MAESLRAVRLAPATDGNPWLAALGAAVRPEFAVDVYHPAPDNPVLGIPECEVASCDVPGVRGHLCNPHHIRWRHAGRPDLATYCATAAPVVKGRTQPSSCRVPGCRRSRIIHQMCQSHWQRWHHLKRPNIDEFVVTVRMYDGTATPCRFPHCDFFAVTSGWCDHHDNRWKSVGRPEFEQFVDHCQNYGVPRIRFVRLPPVARLEMQYAVQARSDARGARLTVHDAEWLINFVEKSGVSSLLDHTLDQWFEITRTTGHRARTNLGVLVRFVYDALADLSETLGADVDEYSRDVWRLRRLGIDGTSANIDFRGFQLVWFRGLVQRWARWRLVTKAGATVAGNIRGLQSFGEFLASLADPPSGVTQLTRDLLEAYLAEERRKNLHSRTRRGRVSAVRTFLEDVHRFDWAPGLAHSCRLYAEDLEKLAELAPRAISEEVMRQIESSENLARLPDETTRTVVRCLMELGLRLKDTITLPIDAVRRDSAGAPFLIYTNNKMRRESSIPIFEDLADALTAQARRSIERHGEQCPWMFPRPTANPDGKLHFAAETLRSRMNRWLRDLDVRDASGKPAKVTPHRFRHTLATRLINDDVDQHVVQRILDHKSPHMTAHYARIHDSTLRRAFEKYRDRVNVKGEVVTLLEDHLGSEAEWLKERLGRAKETLPNGWCGRPLQQACPHPNACLTCPDFLTSAEFLPVHQSQLEQTRRLIATAHADGNFRLVEMNQQVEVNLTTIIRTLESNDGT